MKVEYINETVEPGTLIQENSYNYYDGSEFVMVGKVKSSQDPADSDLPAVLEANIIGRGSSGQERFRIICPFPRPPRPWPLPSGRPAPPVRPEPTPLPAGTVGGFVERMWAYLSIKKLLKDANYLEENKTKAENCRSQALRLSLKVKRPPWLIL